VCEFIQPFSLFPRDYSSEPSRQPFLDALSIPFLSFGSTSGSQFDRRQPGRPPLRVHLPRVAAEDGGAGLGVNIASDLAKQPEPGLMAYGVCRAALLYVTKNLAKEYGPKIRVDAVSPGPIWTRLWTRPSGIVDQFVAHYGVDKEAAVKRCLEEPYMPVGIGPPEDVARAVVFLASPLAKFITGANLDIGGTLRGLILPPGFSALQNRSNLICFLIGCHHLVARKAHSAKRPPQALQTSPFFNRICHIRTFVMTISHVFQRAVSASISRGKQRNRL
jgi:enoyl-ACP reductase-like protein